LYLTVLGHKNIHQTSDLHNKKKLQEFFNAEVKLNGIINDSSSRKITDENIVTELTCMSLR